MLSPIHTFVDHHAQMMSRIYRYNSGSYGVTLTDLDSNLTLPTIELFDDLQQAISHAKRLTGQDA